jgi:serine/threonine protein kinase
MDSPFKKGIKIADFRDGGKMIESGTLLQNRYLIEKQIGEGGMGAVYVAIDQRFGSQVAIKETFFKDDELGAAFEREAHLLNSLHHPALPHVSDYFAENNGYFLVMQYIEGEDLFEILKREGAFPVKDVLHWTDNLLDALDYLHLQEPPIIHRDIKPQNLKITARGDIILLDFGLAKLSSEDSSGMKSIFGYSRKYSPLEQIQGTGTDARSDIFALAATAYHLLTGKPPVEVIARASEIIHGNPDPLRLANEINVEVPISVANVLNSALALNAARRFASAKAMRQALGHAVNELPVAIVKDLPDLNPVIAENFEVKNAAEIENFTALEAFAAEAANNLPEIANNEKLEAIETPISNPEAALPAPETVPEENQVGDLTIHVVPQTKSSSLRYAALAALLICGIFGALYFIVGTNSSNKSNQIPEIQSNIESNVNTVQPAVADSKMPEVIETSLIETAKRSKSSSTRKNVEKKEAADKPAIEVETTEKPRPVISAPQTPHRKEPQTRKQTRPRVADTETIPDIEAVFTGQSSVKIDEKKQRKEKRKQRLKGDVIPF